MSPPSDRALKVFISYSRQDRATADAIVALLEANGIEAIIDRRDLPYGEEWQKELAGFIRSSDTVIWLVSPDSIRSHWCNWELGEVGRLSKRLVPVRIRDIEPESLPQALGKIHLLPAESVFSADQHLQLLIKVLNTDVEWLKEGTRLADRARQWLLKDRDNAMYLRGRALSEAENWSRSRPRSAPPISSETLDYILNSRKAAVVRQRQVVIASLFLAVFGVGLAVYSWQQRNAALTNQSTYLARLSKDQLTRGDAGTSLLLAASALPEWPFNLDRPYTPEASRMLNDAIFSIREIRVFAGHTGDVNTVGFSSNGQTILTSSDDKTARLWRRDAKTPPITLGPHTGKVFSAQFSPDDNTVVTLTEDKAIYLWDARTGQLRSALHGHADQVRSVAFNTTGSMLISASRDGTARIWQLSDGSSRVLARHGGAVNSAAFSPDSSLALTAAADGSAIFWDVETSQPRTRLLGHASPVLGAIFDNAGLKIATYAQDQTARIWDVSSGQVKTALNHGAPINSIAFSPLGNRIITGGRDGVAKLWNPETGALLFELKGHEQAITKVHIDTRGKLAVTASHDGMAIIWDIETGAKLFTLGGHQGPIFDASFTKDGEFLVTGSRDQTARIWRVWVPTVVEKRTNLQTSFRSIGLSHDDTYLALGSTDGSVFLLKRDSLEQLAHASAGEKAITLVTFDPSGERLLVGTETGRVAIYAIPSLALIFGGETDGSEIGGGGFKVDGPEFLAVTLSGSIAEFDGHALKLISVNPGTSKAFVAAISPGRNRVIIGNLDGGAYIASLPTRDRVAVLKGHRGTILYAAFDRTGQRVITASADATARLWDATTGATLQVFEGHESPVVFAGTVGDYVATGSIDRTIRLWRKGLSSPLAQYNGHLANVELVALTRNGSQIISASHDGEVHLWDYSEDHRAMLGIAKRIAPRCLSRQQRERFGVPETALDWCKQPAQN